MQREAEKQRERREEKRQILDAKVPGLNMIITLTLEYLFQIFWRISKRTVQEHFFCYYEKNRIYMPRIYMPRIYMLRKYMPIFINPLETVNFDDKFHKCLS